MGAGQSDSEPWDGVETAPEKSKNGDGVTASWWNGSDVQHD